MSNTVYVIMWVNSFDCGIENVCDDEDFAKELVKEIEAKERNEIEICDEFEPSYYSIHPKVLNAVQ